MAPGPDQLINQDAGSSHVVPYLRIDWHKAPPTSVHWDTPFMLYWTISSEMGEPFPLTLSSEKYKGVKQKPKLQLSIVPEGLAEVLVEGDTDVMKEQHQKQSFTKCIKVTITPKTSFISSLSVPALSSAFKKEVALQLKLHLCPNSCRTIAGQLVLDDVLGQPIIYPTEESDSGITLLPLTSYSIVACRPNSSPKNMDKLRTHPYHQRQVTMPTSNNNSLTKSVKILINENAKASALGTRLWPASVYLTYFYTHYHDYMSDIYKLAAVGSSNSKINVLELGSGTGLTSIALYLACQPKPNMPINIVVTDNRAEIIDLLDLNVKTMLMTETISKKHKTISTALLCWTEPKECDLFDKVTNQPKILFDIVLGADVLYNKTYFDAFYQTLMMYSRKGTILLLGHKRRAEHETSWLEEKKDWKSELLVIFASYIEIWKMTRIA